MGEKRNAYRVLLGKPKGMRPLGRPRLGGRIILKWILYRMGWYGLDSLAQYRDQWRGSCEHGDEPSGSIILSRVSDRRRVLD
jgi:hypothetical protein